MNRRSLVLGLAAAFGACTALLVLVAVAFGEPVALVVAAPLAITTYFMWYDGSGRLARRVANGIRDPRRAGPGRRTSPGGGFGAGARRRGPRSRFGREARRRAEGRYRQRGTVWSQETITGPTEREALRTLGLDTGAGPDEVRRAYRERVKDAHPDHGGNKEAFRRVTAAYERLKG